MNWGDTEDKLVFASVIDRARSAFPGMADSDWRAAKGQRIAFVAAVGAVEGLTPDAAEAAVVRFENSLNYNRYAV